MESPKSLIEDGEQLNMRALFWRNRPGYQRLDAILHVLEDQEQHVAMRIERQLLRKAELSAEVFNVIGFFSVFQGVIFTGVIAFWLKWSYRLDIEVEIYASKNSQKMLEYKLETIKKSDVECFYDRNGQIPGHERIGLLPTDSKCKNVDACDRMQMRSFHIKRILVVMAMVSFSGVFVMAYFAILCNCLVIRKWEGGF